MAKTAFNNIRLGLFVILSIVVFTYVLYRVSNKADLFGGSMDIIATFEDVRGLQPGNNVRFAGINIGAVGDIHIQGDTLVIVTMSVVKEAHTYMKKDAIADIGSDGLVGNMLVNIRPGPGEAPFITDGDTIAGLRGDWAGEMMGNLSTTSSDLTQITSNLNQIAAKINNGSGTLSMLVNDKDMAADFKSLIRELQKTSSQLGSATAKANELMVSVQDGEGLLGRLISDTMSATKFDRMLTNMDTLILVQAKTLMTDLQQSGKTLAVSTEKLNRIIENMDQSGLTGSILNDTAAVRQFEQILENLEEGSGNFNTLMEALQKHWLLKGAVKKVEKEDE